MTDAGRTDTADRVDLLVLSSERVILRERVLWVQVPLKDGLIGIWPGHAPLVAATAAGNVLYDAGDGEERLPIAAGILRVNADVADAASGGRCVILASSLTGEPEREREAEDRGRSLAAEFEEVLSESLTEEELEDLQRTQRRRP